MDFHLPRPGENVYVHDIELQVASVVSVDVDKGRVSVKVKGTVREVPVDMIRLIHTSGLHDGPSHSTWGQDHDPAERQDLASPCYYSPNAEAVSKQGPQHGFARQRRWMSEVPREELGRPGPEAEHGDNLKFSRAPCFGFGSAARRCPLFEAMDASLELGRSAAAAAAAGQSAAPGAPGPLTKRGRKPLTKEDGMSASARTEMQRKLFFPGPGHSMPDYTKSSKVASGPCYSVRSPREGFTAEKSLQRPGPGCYESAPLPCGRSKLAPAYRFGKAERIL